MNLFSEIELKRKERKKELVTFRCNPVVLSALREYASDNGMSISALLNSIAVDFYENHL